MAMTGSSSAGNGNSRMDKSLAPLAALFFEDILMHLQLEAGSVPDMPSLVNWNEVHTVLLDMDGTLLDLYFDNYFWQHFVTERYAIQRNTSFAAAETFLKERFCPRTRHLELVQRRLLVR